MHQKNISILDIVGCLSTAMDLINPIMVNHQRRVGYIAERIAAVVGRSQDEQNNALVAGFLHDCGALSLEERFMTMRFEGSVQNPALHLHAEAGYRLLKKFQPFSEVARYIHFHHLPWANGDGQEFNSQEVLIGSHIIHLADRIEILIDQKSHVLQQTEAIVEKIEKARGTMFAPELVEAFKSLADKESFWLDIINLKCSSILSGNAGITSRILIDNEILRELTAIFSRIIDFRSRFTATHSSGVAACAAMLAKIIGMSDSEQTMMKIAGNFHDLGKLAVPKEILEKPGSLTGQEFCIIKSHPYYTKNILSQFRDLSTIASWASEHHERLDGKGYPCHLRAGELSLGSRIMAVADVFTAITEDRPYRKGMDSRQVIKVLNNQASNNALDGDIVNILISHFEEINGLRVQVQSDSLEEYRQFNMPVTPRRTEKNVTGTVVAR
jgi:HD-GYP domain-containing protein (c-di-GMP phosphodiesterase class II)